MKRLLLFLVVFFLSLTMVRPASALDATRPNNIYGIHLAQPTDEDIKSAAGLVNSSGGEWGYVTLVIQENDRDRIKWQSVFNTLRELRLIPIVRLATNPEGANWRRPNPEDAEAWANFLDSLHWVVKDRYVILFNETNHATEWGGAVDAESYAKISKAFAQELKKRNSDYFIMLGGLDASAPHSGASYQSEDVYLSQVVSHIGKETFENLFDGLSSHSYPNPGFAGSPEGTGRGTVRTYEWELSLLQGLGIEKDLPVFITETGWSSQGVPREFVGSYMRQVYENVWEQDPRVRAVTPFILNYQSEPFLSFSWQKPGSTEFYPQYEEVRMIEKVRGRPEQIERARVIAAFPRELTVLSDFHFTFRVQNLGQSIWSRDEGYRLDFVDSQGNYFFTDLKKVRPFEEYPVDVYFKTDGSLGPKTITMGVFQDNNEIARQIVWEYEKVPWPSAALEVVLYPKLQTSGDNFTLQLFDESENLVFEQKDISVTEGKGYAADIRNVALGPRYRAVILKRYYLPRQTFVRFHKDENEIRFPFMIPLDFSGDGKLGLEDVGALIEHPALWELLFP